MATENKKMQQRRDTAANWTSNNPTLAAGEIGFETDTGKFKIGDGSTAWNSREYFAVSGLVPASAAPTVDADGEIAVDTSVADFSHGIVKVFAGEELALVALPIAELTTPTNGHIIAYNATNDEFELVAPSGGGIGGSTGSTDNAILRADGTGGATVQGSGATIGDNGQVTLTSSVAGLVVRSNTGEFFSDLIQLTSQGYASTSTINQGDRLTFKAGGDIVRFGDAAGSEFPVILNLNASRHLNITVRNASYIGQVIQLAATPTANAFEIHNSSSTVLTAFDATGAWEPPSMADSAAPNNSVYYSTTASKLVYKDSGGTVNNLY